MNKESITFSVKRLFFRRRDFFKDDELAKKWVAAIPDAQIVPLYTVTKDDTVIVYWSVDGVMEKPIYENGESGQSVCFHGLTCFRCLGDQVVEHWATVDYRLINAGKLGEVN